MSKHAPGPWRTWKHMDPNQPRMIVDQNSDPICEIAEHNTNANGNADLLQAAPELLAALEESLKEMEAFRRYWTSPNMGLKRGVCRAEELASTAIAKAKGQP